jgi:hypothetical protein
MIQTINFDADMADLLKAHAALTGLSVSDLISRLLSTHLPDLHELLALVSAHPDVREQAANLLQSFGPESLTDGIKRIAPVAYETLGEQFARQVMQLDPRQAH